MREPVKPSSTHDYPRRRARARATRMRVLDAARALFTERGYVATTIGEIAARADVSPETVYSTFGTKRSVLSELVDVSIAGGDDAPPIFEQSWMQEMREEPDPRRRLQILARNGRSILERRAAVDEVVHGAAAADPEIATLWERGKAERFAGQREALRIVMGAADPAKGMDLETASDILYALGSPETYRQLVVDRGWSGSHFERWYGETLARLLLEPARADIERRVREFVDAYRMAFEAFDAVAIADLFFYPCQITSDAGEITVMTVPTRDLWLPQVGRLVEAYRSIGVRSAEVIELQVFELTPRLAQAAITWRLVDGAGQPLYDFDAAYTLADPGTGLRITAIAQNETPQLRGAVARSHVRA